MGLNSVEFGKLISQQHSQVISRALSERLARRADVMSYDMMSVDANGDQSLQVVQHHPPEVTQPLLEFRAVQAQLQLPQQQQQLWTNYFHQLNSSADLQNLRDEFTQAQAYVLQLQNHEAEVIQYIRQEWHDQVSHFQSSWEATAQRYEQASRDVASSEMATQRHVLQQQHQAAFERLNQQSLDTVRAMQLSQIDLRTQLNKAEQDAAQERQSLQQQGQQYRQAASAEYYSLLEKLKESEAHEAQQQQQITQQLQLTDQLIQHGQLSDKSNHELKQELAQWKHQHAVVSSQLQETQSSVQASTAAQTMEIQNLRSQINAKEDQYERVAAEAKTLRDLVQQHADSARRQPDPRQLLDTHSSLFNSSRSHNCAWCRRT